LCACALSTPTRLLVSRRATVTPFVEGGVGGHRPQSTAAPPFVNGGRSLTDAHAVVPRSPDRGTPPTAGLLFSPLPRRRAPHRWTRLLTAACHSAALIDRGAAVC